VRRLLSCQRKIMTCVGLPHLDWFLLVGSLWWYGSLPMCWFVPLICIDFDWYLWYHHDAMDLFFHLWLWFLNFVMIITLFLINIQGKENLLCGLIFMWKNLFKIIILTKMNACVICNFTEKSNRLFELRAVPRKMSYFITNKTCYISLGIAHPSPSKVFCFPSERGFVAWEFGRPESSELLPWHLAWAIFLSYV